MQRPERRGLHYPPSVAGGPAALLGLLLIRVLLGYWAIWFLVANLFVIGYEKRTLRRRFVA